MFRLFSGRAARFLAPVAMTALLGGSAYAFMATNYVHQSNAGAGVGSISGYSVSQVHYGIVPPAYADGLTGVAGNPSGLARITFELTPSGGNHPATDVAIWFNGNTANVWSTNNGLCHQWDAEATHTWWSCNLGGSLMHAGSAMQLDVAASG